MNPLTIQFKSLHCVEIRLSRGGTPDWLLFLRSFDFRPTGLGGRGDSGATGCAHAAPFLPRGLRFFSRCGSAEDSLELLLERLDLIFDRRSTPELLSG